MNENYDHIQDYLNKIISEDIRLIISDFAILWNKYEESLFDKNYHSIRIEEKIIDRMRNNDIEINSDFILDIKSLYSRLKSYFAYRRIKFEFNDIKHHYSIRDNDISKDKLNHLIESDNFLDNLHFILLIIGRIRNNMFHGIKGINDLPNQKELFMICNETMVVILKATNNWPL